MKSNKAKIHYIKIKDIVGTLYYSEWFTNSLIYCKGAPTSWDTGGKDYLDIANKYRLNILVPDYLGYARSDGNQFNMSSCVNTIKKCVNTLKGKTNVTLYPQKKSIRINSKKVILVGGSFGGCIVPFAANEVEYIGLLAPLLDWRTQSSGEYPEEDMVEFDILMSNVLNNIYRGYKDSEFHKLVQKDEEYLAKYNPMDNIHLLSNNLVTIVHGNKDKSINWRKSKNFFEKLSKANEKTSFKLLNNVGHGGTLKFRGLSSIIESFPL